MVKENYFNFLTYSWCFECNFYERKKKQKHTYLSKCLSKNKVKIIIVGVVWHFTSLQFHTFYMLGKIVILMFFSPLPIQGFEL